jgi:hypothetical protein
MKCHKSYVKNAHLKKALDVLAKQYSGQAAKRHQRAVIHSEQGSYEQSRSALQSNNSISKEGTIQMATP